MCFQSVKCDVLIIGGGGAAAMAALSAMKLGADVAIVSKEASFVGGATIQSSGGISIVHESADSPETFYKDTMRGGGNLNNPKLVKILSERTMASMVKLEDCGFYLDRTSANRMRTVIHSEGHSWPRGYLDRRENLGWCHALGQALARSSVSFYPEIMILKLLVNQGQVVGALGFSIVTGEYLVFNAKAVLLATGGLGQIYEVTTNAKTLSGDGFTMAWDVGAKLIDMEMVQFLPLAFPYPKAKRGIIIGMCSLFGPNVKLYNGLGERYMRKYDPERLEYTTRDTASRANFTEIMQGRGTERGAIIVDPTENDPSLLWRHRNGLPLIYKRVRDVFGEDAASWKKPFEAIPSQHFFMGGVMIDENCKSTVPGLFAVGEVSGGVQGANRLSGNALTEILVFGDLAGEKAAQWVADRKLIPPDTREIEDEISKWESKFNSEPSDGVRPFRIREKIQKTMWSYLGPVRDRVGMEKAAAALEGIQRDDLKQISLGTHQPIYNREKVEAAETEFMVKTALAIARSALTREESRGSHYREDFPLADDEHWLKNIVVSKDEGGEIAISCQHESESMDW